MSNRLTVNAGLRYEIFTPRRPTSRTASSTSIRSNLRLIYAGRGWRERAVNLKTRKNNFAPRLGLTSIMLRRRVDGPAHRLRHHLLSAGRASACNLLGQQVPYTISQNVNGRGEPDQLGQRARRSTTRSRRSSRCKPQTTAELNAANPRVLGHWFENETPSTQQWHLGVERQLLPSVVAERRLCRQRRQAPRLLLEPQRGAARHGIASLAAADPAAVQLPQHHPVRSAQPVVVPRPAAKVNQRFTNGLQLLFSYTCGKSLDYGGSAASGGGQTGGPQTVTDLNAGKGPSGFDVRHRAVISSV